MPRGSIVILIDFEKQHPHVFMIDLLFPIFDRILDASKSSVLDDFFSDSFPYRGKQTKKNK